MLSIYTTQSKALFNKYAPLMQKTIIVKERPLKLSDNTKHLIQMRNKCNKNTPEYSTLQKAVKRLREIDSSIISNGMWATVNNLLNSNDKNQSEKYHSQQLK